MKRISPFKIAYAVLCLMVFAIGIGTGSMFHINQVTQRLQCTSQMKIADNLALGVAYDHSAYGLYLMSHGAITPQQEVTTIEIYHALRQTFTPCLTSREVRQTGSTEASLISQFRQDYKKLSPPTPTPTAGAS